MPLTLTKITNNTASVTFPYLGDSVTVTYYPGRITEKTFAELEALAKTEADSVIAGFVSFNEMLVHLVKGWDVYEDDAQLVMFPLDASRLAELPLLFRSQVLQEIVEDVRPNQTASQG